MHILKSSSIITISSVQWLTVMVIRIVEATGDFHGL